MPDGFSVSLEVGLSVADGLSVSLVVGADGLSVSLVVGLSVVDGLSVSLEVGLSVGDGLSVSFDEGIEKLWYLWNKFHPAVRGSWHTME